MKRNEIRATIEQHLIAVGFTRDAWAWNRSELLVAAGNVMRRIDLRSGMSQKALSFQLGRISGWAELLGIQTFTGPVLVAEAA